MDYCHYETSEDAKFSVACGANPLSVKVLTNSTQLVTCPLCRNSPAFRLTVLEHRTDGRPSDQHASDLLITIRAVLDEYDDVHYPAEDALSIIKELINKEGPSHG